MAKRPRVALLHSDEHTKVLHEAMQHIHQDRDVLLHALLDYCGFGAQSPKFFRVVAPKRATRHHLAAFHDAFYLDLLEFTPNDDDNYESSNELPSLALLDSVGLTDDCAIPPEPKSRAALWNYCRHVAGGSIHAAQLLVNGRAEVALHWGGGRHHAHSYRAGGFCYVNDVVLAIKHLARQSSRILYIDIDIHHSDGVQDAFYDTDQVMTVSFHRHAKGFFPSSTGSAQEKGMHTTLGVGYNLNIPMPHACTDKDFIVIYQHGITTLFEAFSPEAVVLCVGADGLKGDPVVGQSDQWNLTPEGIAECVRFTSHLARDKKLLVLGGGGYHPARTARTFLLCTAAACESARPGLLTELPADVPKHEFFPRYGPDFRLVHDSTVIEIDEKEERGEGYRSELVQARKEIDLAVLFLQAQKKKKVAPAFGSFEDEEDLGWDNYKKDCTKKGRRRR